MEPPSCPSPPPEPQNLRNWPQNLPPRERTQLRNRRYAALTELIKEGDYFSEEQMRLRAPGLFHHYIGRFRDPKTPQNHPKNHPKNPQNFPKNPKNPEIHPKMSQNDPKVAQIGPKVAANGPKMAPGLRELLLTALEAGEAEEDDDEEEEDEDEDEDEDEEQLPDEAEQELLRLEFTSLMHQRFLEGLDRDFDYSLVDAGGAAGALDLLARDLEDQYFDEEEPGPAPPLL